MVDVFQPVAKVMSSLQGISVNPWKAYRWVQDLVRWFKEASIECHKEGDLDYFPRMKKNAEVK